MVISNNPSHRLWDAGDNTVTIPCLQNDVSSVVQKIDLGGKLVYEPSMDEPLNKIIFLWYFYPASFLCALVMIWCMGRILIGYYT